jgi:hypothetical protein
MQSTSAPLCFVIGPIGSEGTETRKHADMLLHALIKHVLETGEFGYTVRRADEVAEPGMIGDRMISDLIHAELVVADLTDLNANAFYELGIRHSTEKPTIHVARIGTVVPFDNVSHRTIFVDLTDWHNIELSRTRLAAAARAINSPNFRVSNPITQANASFKMRESADPRDQLIAGLQTRMQSLESELRGSHAQSPRAFLGDFDLLPSYSIREDSILEVDTRPLLHEAGGKVYFDLSKYLTVKDLLDGIYEELDRSGSDVEPKTYRIKWILEDAGSGKKFTNISGYSQIPDGDHRTLKEVGIFSWYAASSNKDF